MDSRYWAVSYTNVFRWSYSSEAALILLARLADSYVSHNMWVGASAVICPAVLCLPLHPDSQIRYSSIRADNESCDRRISSLNCRNDLLLTGKEAHLSRISD